MWKKAALRVALLGGIALPGCASTGPFVWADSVTSAEDVPKAEVVIRDNDLLRVRVWKEENLSSEQRVRPDGKIAMPVMGEIVARGKKPSQLAKEMEDKLKSVLNQPNVSIAVEQPTQFPVAVVGEVKQGGTFQIDNGGNVLHALAAANGLNDYADPDRIFVVRKGLQQRVRFRYSDLRSGDPKSVGFFLRHGDVVVVE